MPTVDDRPRASRWSLRPATAEDLDAIVELEAEGFARPWTLAMYREELARESSWLGVALDSDGDGSVVGFVCAWRILDACHLLRIATRLTLRNAGIARTLVRDLLADARAQGCSHIELEVASQNASALALYRGLGFEIVGRRPGYYSKPVDDAVLMNLVLRA